jgi:hypothetical protein
MAGMTRGVLAVSDTAAVLLVVLAFVVRGAIWFVQILLGPPSQRRRCAATPARIASNEKGQATRGSPRNAR